MSLVDPKTHTARQVNIKLCQRLPKHWEYLRNFTRKKHGRLVLAIVCCAAQAPRPPSVSVLRPRTNSACLQQIQRDLPNLLPKGQQLRAQTQADSCL